MSIARTAPAWTPRASLRMRVSLWNAAVVAVTITALTAAAIYEERFRLVRTEAATVRALLDHLAAMPEFQGDVETVAAHLEHMRESLRAEGSRLELVPPGASVPLAGGAAKRVVATRSLSLREGVFELRYLSDADRLQAMTRRSMAVHLVYGLVALAAILGGTEWILRTKLLAPLRSLSRQIEHMRDGGGWRPQTLRSDDELAAVSSAVANLGPALERQVLEWIEVERRSGVVLAINSIRRRLREHQACPGTAGLQPDWIARALAEEENAAVGGGARPRAGG